jgi:hypothetical protein
MIYLIWILAFVVGIPILLFAGIVIFSLIVAPEPIDKPADKTGSHESV